jgi:uncharacterized protein YjcR
VDWKRIKAEYIAGGTSYRKLAEKYGVPRTTLERTAKNEKWADLRRQAEGEAEAKIINAISNKKVDIDDKYFRLVDKLLDKAEETIDDVDKWHPTLLKVMATTMKYLKECKGIKSEADMREQDARIKKLQMEVAYREEDDDKPSGVVLMPAITEEIKPPIEEGNDG